MRGISCCQPASVGDLGLVREIVVEKGCARVEVLPCCVFGMTRLAHSIESGLLEVKGITRVEVNVAWDRAGRQMPNLVQLDLKGWSAQYGYRPWGERQHDEK